MYNLRTCQNPLDVFTGCKLQLSYFKRMKGTTKEQHIFGDFLSRLLAYAVSDHRDRRGARDCWVQGGTQLQLHGAASVLHPRAALGWAPPCPWCQVALRPHQVHMVTLASASKCNTGGSRTPHLPGTHAPQMSARFPFLSDCQCRHSRSFPHQP